MRRLLAWGVDGLITDRPDRLARVLHEHVSRPLPPGPDRRPVEDRTLRGLHPMVAERLGKTPKAVSYLRDRLIQKGTIFAEGRVLRFAVPGFADWLLAGPGAADPG